MMETMIVIRCGSAPVPTVLGEHPRIEVSEVPDKDEINRALAEVGTAAASSSAAPTRAWPPSSHA